MSSVIYYRFKSYKDFSVISFEGSCLSLWELKYEIVTQRRMTSKDFDLLFYDEETQEELIDEYAPISRNSYIIVHRIPAWMSKNGFQLRERKTEGNTGKKFYKEPPESYVCFRCGNKGHFIQHCPTNSDKNYDIVKIRKPSGIPKDFLVKVEGEVDKNGAVLITQDGFVRANPQTQDWKRQRLQYQNNQSKPRCLRCSNHSRESVKTQCGHIYCDGCIQIGERCLECMEIISKIYYEE